MALREIKVGKVNDCIMYGCIENGGVTPCGKSEFIGDHERIRILYDSGVHATSETEINKLICEQAEMQLFGWCNDCRNTIPNCTCK